MPIKWKYALTLVDGSGSMEDHIKEAVTGYRGHLRKLGTLPISVRKSLTIFDMELRPAYTNAYLAEAKGLDECPEFDPAHGGGTALRDSILAEIARQEQLIPTFARDAREGEAELTVLMGILTDGEDTGSKHSDEEVKAKIEQKRQEGWEFVFIGPDRGVGLAFGIKPENVKALKGGGAGIAEAFAQISESAGTLLLGEGSR